MIDEKDFSSSSELGHDEHDEIEGKKIDSSDEEETDIESCSIADLEEKNSELKCEIEDLKNRFLRVSAEYDNYRKRTLREKSELYGDACLDIIAQILPILDNLERANSVEADLDSFKKGIGMVINLFYDILQKLGVKEIDSTGKFDPNLHEAVAHISDESLEKNTIVEVLQKGYLRNDKVVRHSMVKVAN